jgi:hypothetical protein
MELLRREKNKGIVELIFLYCKNLTNGVASTKIKG